MKSTTGILIGIALICRLGRMEILAVLILPIHEHEIPKKVGQLVKNLPAMQETPVRSLGQEDPLEKEMATHSSILAWRIPMDRGAWWATVQRVRHVWVTKQKYIKWTNRFQINIHKISTIWFYFKCMYACQKIWSYNSKNDSKGSLLIQTLNRLKPWGSCNRNQGNVSWEKRTEHEG